MKHTLKWQSQHASSLQCNLDEVVQETAEASHFLIHLHRSLPLFKMAPASKKGAAKLSGTTDDFLNDHKLAFPPDSPPKTACNGFPRKSKTQDKTVQPLQRAKSRQGSTRMHGFSRIRVTTGNGNKRPRTQSSISIGSPKSRPSPPTGDLMRTICNATKDSSSRNESTEQKSKAAKEAIDLCSSDENTDKEDKARENRTRDAQKKPRLSTGNGGSGVMDSLGTIGNSTSGRQQARDRLAKKPNPPDYSTLRSSTVVLTAVDLSMEDDDQNKAINARGKCSNGTLSSPRPIPPELDLTEVDGEDRKATTTSKAMKCKVGKDRPAVTIMTVPALKKQPTIKSHSQKDELDEHASSDDDRRSFTRKQDNSLEMLDIVRAVEKAPNTVNESTRIALIEQSRALSSRNGAKVQPFTSRPSGWEMETGFSLTKSNHFSAQKSKGILFIEQSYALI
jgi:hypothetical protein